jgi:hypothetical protein
MSCSLALDLTSLANRLQILGQTEKSKFSTLCKAKFSCKINTKQLLRNIKAKLMFSSD